MDWPLIADNIVATVCNTVAAADSVASSPSDAVVGTFCSMDATDSTIPEPFAAVFASDIHSGSEQIAEHVVAVKAVAVSIGTVEAKQHSMDDSLGSVLQDPSTSTLKVNDSSTESLEVQNQDDLNPDVQLPEVLEVPVDPELVGFVQNDRNSERYSVGSFGSNSFDLVVVAVSFEATKRAMSLAEVPSDDSLCSLDWVPSAVMSYSVGMDPEESIVLSIGTGERRSDCDFAVQIIRRKREQYRIERQCSVRSLFAVDIGSFDWVHLYCSYCSD